MDFKWNISLISIWAEAQQRKTRIISTQMEREDTGHPCTVEQPQFSTTT